MLHFALLFAISLKTMSVLMKILVEDLQTGERLQKHQGYQLPSSIAILATGEKWQKSLTLKLLSTILNNCLKIDAFSSFRFAYHPSSLST